MGVEGGTRGFEVIVYGLRDRGGGVGGEEVDPGVGERDYTDGDAVFEHEGALGGEGGVGGVDWAAAMGEGGGWVVVGGEDDEAGWGGGWVWWGVDVRDGCAGGEEGDVGWWVEVGVDVDDEGRGGGGRHAGGLRKGVCDWRCSQ